MNFRSWLLTEEAIFLKNLLNNHQVIYLGKMGLWNVYSAIATKCPGGIIALDQYQRGEVGIDFCIEDRFAERPGDVKMHCNNATSALMGIGFPKYTTNMVFMDLSDMKNWITGGGVGGYAADKQHAFTVSRRNVSERTIVHEHAHMWWMNVLARPAKRAFIKWYEENVSNWITKPGNFTKYAAQATYPIDMVAAKVLEMGLEKQGQHVFMEKLEKIVGGYIETYFRLRKAVEDENPEKIIETALMDRFRRYVPAYLKHDMPMRSSYGHRDVKAGDVVQIERGSTGYMINIFEEYNSTLTGRKETRHFEYDGVIPFEEIHKYVKFDESLLKEQELQEIRDKVKLAKNKISAYLAPKSKADEIRQAFDETMADTFRWYAKYDGWEFQYDSKLNSRGDWYNTWVSMIGRRGKAGKLNSIDDVRKTFLDAAKAKLYFSQSMIPTNAEAKMKSQIQTMKQSISSPAGRDLRAAIRQSGAVPSDYSAANYDELWAEVVENAAFSPQRVSRELRKLLFEILSGIVADDTEGLPIKKPRRLQRRKHRKEYPLEAEGG